MNKQQPYRATILPIPEGTPRPLWSVMIPTYNCANYLRETLASVLAQDPGPEVMQIEVVDDYSTKDDPEAVVRELAGDRVSFYRQPENVGYIKNFETCLQRSRGELIHLLHGDDIVLKGFYQKLQRIFEQNSEIGAAFCRVIYMDEQGNWEVITPLQQPKRGVLNNSLEQIVINSHIQTASIVVRRNIYEQLGGFDSRFICCCEDWEMWVRIATQYQIGYEVEPLAAYRQMSVESLTKNSVRSGKYAQDIRKAHEIVESYLPNYLSRKVVNKIFRRSRKNSALKILEFANEMLNEGDKAAAVIQIQEALKCSSSLQVVKKSIHLISRIGKHWLKKTVSTAVVT